MVVRTRPILFIFGARERYTTILFERSSCCLFRFQCSRTSIFSDFAAIFLGCDGVKTCAPRGDRSLRLLRTRRLRMCDVVFVAHPRTASSVVSLHIRESDFRATFRFIGD